MSVPTVKLTITYLDVDVFDNLSTNYPDAVLDMESKNNQMQYAGKLFQVDIDRTGSVRRIYKTYDSEESANEWLNFLDQNIFTKYSIPLHGERSIQPL